MLDHLKIGKAHLLGYSMGGDIADKIREKHAERVRTAILGGVLKGWMASDFDMFHHRLRMTTRACAQG